MSAWRALRAVWRVEARQVLRHRGRSLLLGALVGVPVAAIVGGATLLRIIEPTTEERRSQLMGAAALRVAVPPSHDSLAAAIARLPRGARHARVLVGTEQVQTPGRRLRARLLATAPEALGSDSLAHGLVRLTQGRFAAHAGEVALSPALLAGLGVALGDTVTLAYGGPRAVCGVVVDPEALADPLVVRPPAVVEERVETQVLVGLPADRVPAAAAALRAAGLAVTTRAESGERDPVMTAVVFFFGGVGFLEAALVIAAAFAVSLRRRQRELGLLGSVGATADTMSVAMVGSSAAIGAIGAIAGALVGLASVAAIQPWLDTWLRRWTGGYEVPWLAVSAAVALGVITATLAALLPVRQNARLPIRVLLGGRRPVVAAPRGWLVAGLAMAALALALVTFLPRASGLVGGLSVIGGAVLAVLGFGACSPWVLGALARHAAPLPPAWRLAVRDAGRFAARNGPVVTAVLAGMSLGITVAVLVTSVEARLDTFPQAYRDDQLLIEGAAAEAVARQVSQSMPTLAVAPLAALYAHGMPVRVRAVSDSGAGHDWVALGDDSLLAVLAADAGAAAFARGDVLALGGAGDASRLRAVAGRDARDLGWRGATRVAVNQRVHAPAYAVSAAAVAARGLESGPPPRRTLVPWMVRLRAPVTAAALEQAQRLAAAAPGTSVDAARLHRAPARAIYRFLLVACLLTGLVVVLVATALTAAESVSDEHVLRTVGAPPGLLRAHLAARATTLALLGCVLAVPAGLLSALGILGSANIDLAFQMPWRDILFTVAGLPLLTYAITWWRSGAGDGMRSGRPLAGGLLLTAMLATAAQAASPAAARSPAIRWEPYVGRAVDGTPLPGELGRIRVPERRDRPSGATIEIAFVRYRTTHPRPGPPLVFLEGGPGAPGVEGSAFIATHPRIRALEQCDVIGIDQRGTGLSRPELSQPVFAYTLPLDRDISRDEEAAAFEAAAARAAAYWHARGVDLSAYHTDASADDVDDVRRALGLERIALYGSSYGSHLGLAYLRRHGAHVSRAVLCKVEGPDDTWKRPALVQRQLERVHAMAAADPAVRARIPDLLGTLRRLLDQLERAPVTARARRGQPDSARIVLGAHDLRCAVAHSLGTTRGTAGLPRLLDACTRGDWSRLADLAWPARRADVGSMMTLAMDCASGMSPERRAQVRREALDPANVLGDAMHAPFFDRTCITCALPERPAAFRAPFACDVPVLFVSGLLDARTPPDNVQAIRSSFSRAAHVRVSGTGHDARELLSDEFRDLLQAFLRGEPVRDTDLSLPFRFVPLDGD